MSQLTLLSGKVGNLKTHQGYKSFIGSGAAKASGAAAVGAAASGALFNSSLLTMGAMQRENVTYYTCKVDGITLTGYLNEVRFKNTDELDFVVEYDANDPTQAFAYAVRKPEQRKLWVIDRMSVGHEIQRRFLWKTPLIIVPFIAVWFLIILITTYIDDGDFDFLIDFWFEIFVLGMGGGSILMYLIGYLGFRLTLYPKSKIATHIIRALGYDNPADVSLGDNSYQIEKDWEAKHGKPLREDDLFVLYY